jgi:predicted esterase
MRAAASLPLLVAATVVAQNPAPLPVGRVVERVTCLRDTSQTYALYLPRAYDPGRQWPVLLVFDPGGRALISLELFREPAERHGWIVMSSHDTRSGDRDDPNVKAVNAMWPEVYLRFAADPRRIYTAGFSAGAHLAWILATRTGQVAGVIASGGRFIPDILPDKPSFASFAAAGDADFNFVGMRQADGVFAKLGVPHRFEVFQGPHRWLPPELATLAVEWMELQAMRQALRPRDDSFVEAVYHAEIEASRTLEADSQLIDALRRYQAIARDFTGLRDTSEPTREAKRLEASAATAAQITEERRWEKYEERWSGSLSRVVGELVNLDPPPPTSRLLSELEIAKLKRLAAEGGIAGTTGRRLLASASTTLASFLTRRLLAEERLPQAIRALEVAVAIRPEDAVAWYNLACVRARDGQTRSAIEALTAAIDRGFNDVKLLETDPDLASLRGQDGYRTLLRRMRPEP